jgi:hypothetical protein
LRKAVSDFFRHKLEGTEAAVGVFHGDFGVRNLLVQGDRITGLIDWEAGSLDGLPPLDALNYLISTQLQYEPAMRLLQAAPLLAAGPWPHRDEWSFIERCYSALGMDGSRHAGWAYLACVHAIGQRLTNLMRYDPVAIDQQVVGVLRTMVEQPC